MYRDFHTVATNGRETMRGRSKLSHQILYEEADESAEATSKEAIVNGLERDRHAPRIVHSSSMRSSGKGGYTTSIYIGGNAHQAQDHHQQQQEQQVYQHQQAQHQQQQQAYQQHAQQAQQHQQQQHQQQQQQQLQQAQQHQQQLQQAQQQQQQLQQAQQHQQEQQAYYQNGVNGDHGYQNQSVAPNSHHQNQTQTYQDETAHYAAQSQQYQQHHRHHQAPHLQYHHARVQPQYISPVQHPPNLIASSSRSPKRSQSFQTNGHVSQEYDEQEPRHVPTPAEMSEEARRNALRRSISHQETSRTTSYSSSTAPLAHQVTNGNSQNGEQRRSLDSLSSAFHNNLSLQQNTKSYNGVPPAPPLAEAVFVGRRDVRNPALLNEQQIVSVKGSVRGFKNRVRAGIATFWQQPPDQRNFRLLEQGKLVMYATSMTVVRDTSERCKLVRKLLQNHMVRYEERDLYMSRENQQELKHRLALEGIQDIHLPHVFADGIHIGGASELEKLNEAGELRALLDNYQKITVRFMCEKCGGYRFVPCETCHGSKRSLIRNHFTEEFCALRCMHCDDNGLRRCDLCIDQQE